MEVSERRMIWKGEAEGKAAKEECSTAREAGTAAQS